MHVVVARSTFRSQNVQNTPATDHFWQLRCRNYTPLWCEAHLEVKMYKTLGVRTTFGSWDVRKSARRCGAKHIHYTHYMYTTLHVRDYTFWTFTTLQTLHYIVARTTLYTKLHYTTTGFATTPLDTQMSYTSLQLHFTTLHYTPLKYTTLHYTTLQYTPLQ